MLRRFVFHVLIFVLVISAQIAGAQTTHPSATQPQAQPAVTLPAGIDWNSLEEKTRAGVNQLLDSPHWPIRVFALLRLERYRGEGVQQLIHAKLTDKSWQVRCFALWLAREMKITLVAEELANETDGRVIRTALRCGFTFPEKKLKELAPRLMRAKNIDELMVGLEIAAASDIEPIRAEAAKHIERLIKNMDNAVAALISRRLAVVLNLDKAPENVREWNTWLQSQHEAIKLAPVGAGFSKANAAKPLVAEMDDEVFARLLDYLDGLKQRDLDLVICMDATASMVPMVNQARAGIDSLILFLGDISREMRLAFIAYRDHDNKPVWDGHPFTTDLTSIRNYLFNLRITGGADYPEAVFEGLAACAELKWNKKATREIVLVGDAPPHPEDVYKVRALMDSYRDLGITVHAAHIPMEYHPGYVEAMSPPQAEEAKKWLIDYNKSTGESFADIATEGGGRKTEMNKAEELVPAIMHFTIEEAWWETFDQFYAMYLVLCR